jgi:hypothetical protein
MIEHRMAQCAPGAASILLALLATGCGNLNTRYGERAGPAADSINGTRVLGDMFAAAGHRVTSSSYVSPKLGERTDVFVWFPDDFRPPDKKTRKWFEQWLSDEPDRMLVYVGRDYDATADYWTAVEAAAPEDQQEKIGDEIKAAETAQSIRRDDMPAHKDCDWFLCLGKKKPRSVHTLSGDDDWTAGVDPAKLGIELEGRYVPDRWAEIVVESENDALVSRQRIGHGWLYVVTNGSFLLNLPLVNHEHRKLAGRLIDHAPAEARVVFLESSRSGLQIYDREPDAGERTGLEILVVRPFDQVLLHLGIVGAIFCFVRLPIFGRARPGDPPRTADFGAHVSALGALLAKTGDRPAAAATIEHYESQKKITDGHR